MQPDSRVRREYIDAFTEIVARIAATLTHTPRRLLPVRMYVAGGAALNFYTGERVSEDIDAVFSRRVALPRDLEVAYPGCRWSSALVGLRPSVQRLFRLAA